MKRRHLKQLKIKKNNFGGSSSADSWSTTNDCGEIESINPATEKLIAKVYNCNSDDYSNVIKAAKKNFQSWRQVPAPKRGEIVRQIGNALRLYKEALATLVAAEMGKSLQEGLGEVQEMIDMADLAVGQSRMLYGKTMHSERARHRMYEQWQPLGVVGVVTAFNFPVAVWAWNAFLAIICGNTVVWKPSSKTPLCAIAIQHICDFVMADNNLEGIFNLFITKDRKLSDQLIQDKRVALISFTGSSHVGRHVSETVSKRMGKCLLECSGNNAVIIDETADLTLAVPAVVFGAIGTAGQRCTSARRLIIHESIYADVINQLISAYQKVTIGDPLDKSNLMGPLIDEQAVNQFDKAVNDATHAGGKVLFGGERINGTGYFVEPTIIKAQNDWPIVQNETFAPILYVMSYQSFDEAIAMQNNVCQGLSSALFSDNLAHAEQFLSSMGSDCGIANVNIGTSGAEIGGAFGGEKETGGGREAGSDAWKTYMRRQTNTINWSTDLTLAQDVQFNLFEKK